MRQWIDAINLFESKRGLAPIGEMRAKVFWNPRRSDMLAMLAKSKYGDLRGSWIQTAVETLTAIWPARSLGHWNFHNECFQREGIKAIDTVDLRVVQDLSILTEEQYWKNNIHYEGDGFYCSFFPTTDITTFPDLERLFGPLKIIDQTA